jgi:general secretion pathway protein K
MLMDTSIQSKAGKISVTEKGIALLMVLWVLTVLTAIVFSFSFMARTEGYAALSFRQTTEKKFLAEAGMERGVAELFYMIMNKNAALVAPGKEVWRTDGRPYKIATDNGYYIISIRNEAGKVDINTIPELILRNLLRNSGLDLDKVDIAVDSLMDWKDPDDLHRLHGAEDDYYMSLPNPYKTKNAAFETLDELLLVKGITPEILYGTKGKRGIIDLLTVNSTMTKISINAAPREVLLAVPGITPERADSIITLREAQEIQDIQGLLGDSFSVASPYIDLGEASSYTIESAGYKDSEKSGYTIWGTVTLDRNNTFKYLYYKSPVHIET